MNEEIEFLISSKGVKNLIDKLTDFFYLKSFEEILKDENNVQRKTKSVVIPYYTYNIRIQNIHKENHYISRYMSHDFFGIKFEDYFKQEIRLQIIKDILYISQYYSLKDYLKEIGFIKN